jgi:hypothetical protein
VDSKIAIHPFPKLYIQLSIQPVQGYVSKYLGGFLAFVACSKA